MKTIASKMFFLLALGLLSSCAQNRLLIGNHVTLCCPGNYEDYSSYEIEVVDMPVFLRDYVVAEFETAMTGIGMTRYDSESDLIVTLRYQHVNLNYEQEDIDPFYRSDSSGEELYYIAVIEVLMREPGTDVSVWEGNIRRIHYVTPGEYMHEDRARVAFRETFHDLLSSYPNH